MSGAAGSWNLLTGMPMKDLSAWFAIVTVWRGDLIKEDESKVVEGLKAFEGQQEQRRNLSHRPGHRDLGTLVQIGQPLLRLALDTSGRANSRFAAAIL